MADSNSLPPFSNALDRTLSELHASEPVLEGRNGRQLQAAVEAMVKELCHDEQLRGKLLSETKMGLGLALGKFLAWKAWTEIEKADKRKAAAKPRGGGLTLRLPGQHLESVKELWPTIRSRFQERTGFALSEPTLGPSDEGWSIELRGGLLGRRSLPEDWQEPLVNFLVEHAPRFLTLSMVKQLVDEVRAEVPVVGEELERLRIPTTLIYRVLEGLLEEAVSIQEMETILTALVLNWEPGQDRLALLSIVRTALSPWICRGKEVRPGVLRAIKTGRRLEEMFTESIRYAGGGETFHLEAQQRGMIVVLIRQALQQLQQAGTLVLLTNSRFRKELHTILHSDIPELVVLGESEIHRGYRVEVVAVIDFKQPARPQTLVNGPTEEAVNF